METLNQIFLARLSKNDNDYEKSFKDIADILLNKHNLFVKDTEFELIEIEVYYQDKNHDDISVHGDLLQQESDTWYVHHNTGRGGIDITFGNDTSYGGILIRGIKEVGSEEYIDGPVNAIDKILDILDIKYNDLQDKLLKGIYSDPLRLEKKDNKGKTIYQGPRVGLTEKPGEQNNYLVSPYRYVVDIKHKFDEKEIVYAYSLKLSSSDSDYNEKLSEIYLKESLADNKKQLRKEKIVEYLKKNNGSYPQSGKIGLSI